MHYNINKLLGWAMHLTLFLAIISVSGCAVKPWTDPLQDEELQTATGTINHIMEKQESCGNTIAGDLSLFIRNSLNQNAVAGYFQFTKPSDFRFIVSNSFGQPILITTGNQISFQLINTISRTYLAGSLKSFGIRNNIPPYVLKGNWQEWITGSKTQPAHPVEIRNDLKSNGIWATYENGSEELEHLFIDLDQQKVTRRLLENKDGKRWAEIQYEKWITKDSCNQPSEIVIKGLGFNFEIRFQIANISITDEQRVYRLPVPPGFSRTYLP